MIVTICSAIKKDGAPCAAKTILESEYCMSHHPESAEWRSKGGRNKSNVQRAHNKMPDGLRPIVDGLLTGFDQVHSGDLEPRQLSAMAQGATALIKLAEFVLLEERLSKMEDRINGRYSQTD
jgi:hypothetical protein